MPIAGYSLLKGRAVDRREGSGKQPHYQVLVIDDTAKYRIAINVQSADKSEVFYLVRSNFSHPICDALLAAPRGLTAVASKPGGLALDFIRGNLMKPSEMVQLPMSAPGPDNDLNDKIDSYVQRAMADEAAEIYALGQAWGPEPKLQDQYFHFLPGHGIHDIHMNQGNPPGAYEKDNGPWQDGGLFFHFPGQDQWVAVFLKFQTQGWHTDDVTGDIVPGAGGGPPSDTPGEPGVIPPIHQPTLDQPDGQVRIVAALVNDVASPEHETVTLLNTTSQPVDLTGWTLKDKQKAASPLEGVLPPHETLRVAVRPPMALSNKGGLISLINAAGLKVDGVAYTKAQASQPGRTLAF
jgi:uncharacterized protein YukJ